MPEAKKMYLELADLAFPELQGTPENAKLDNMLNMTAALSSDLGLESKLHQVGVKESDLDLLATDAMKQTRLLINNPREMSYEAAFNIYQKAL